MEEINAPNQDEIIDWASIGNDYLHLVRAPISSVLAVPAQSLPKCIHRKRHGSSGNRQSRSWSQSRTDAADRVCEFYRYGIRPPRRITALDEPNLRRHQGGELRDHREFAR